MGQEASSLENRLPHDWQTMYARNLITLFSKNLSAKRDAETPLGIVFFRLFAAAERHTAIPGATAPATTALHAARLGIPLILRIVLRTTFIGMPLIAAPLPYVTAHPINA